MKLYEYHIYWRYSSENHEHGVIKANTLEEARDTLKRLDPDIISCDVYELEFNFNGVCTIYSH